MSEKEGNNLFSNRKAKNPQNEEKELQHDNDNLSKMINASRAFRNLPPEFVMDSSDLRGKD